MIPGASTVALASKNVTVTPEDLTGDEKAEVLSQENWEVNLNLAAFAAWTAMPAAMALGGAVFFLRRKFHRPSEAETYKRLLDGADDHGHE